MARPILSNASPAQLGSTGAWSRLQSVDYAEFVSNLRIAGCPEVTITAILRSEVTRAHAPMFAEIVKSGSFTNPKAGNLEGTRKRAELNAKIDAILYDQLSLQRPIRSANTLFTAEQEEKIAEARKRFPFVRKDPTNPETVIQSNSNRVARLEFLSQHLSPEQLRFYKLDREGEASRVELLLQGMQPTRSEFLKVADAIEGKDTSILDGVLRPELLEDLRKVLSPARLALLQELQREEYRQICNMARLFDLAPDTVSTLISLRRETFTRDRADYERQVKALLRQPRAAELYLSNTAIHPNPAP